MQQHSLPDIPSDNFHEINYKNPTSLILNINDLNCSNPELTNQKWVLNKLLEMKFENIEAAEGLLSDNSINSFTISKPDLMNACLDVLSFHSEEEEKGKETNNYSNQGGLLLTKSLVYFQKFGLDPEAKFLNKKLITSDVTFKKIKYSEEAKHSVTDEFPEKPKTSRELNEIIIFETEKENESRINPIQTTSILSFKSSKNVISRPVDKEDQKNIEEMKCTLCKNEYSQDFFMENTKLCFDCYTSYTFEPEKTIMRQPLNLNKAICEICMGDYDNASMVRISSFCIHEFCPSCANSYLKESIQIGKVKEIKCPSFTCKNIIKPNEIKEFIKDEELVKKYERFLLRLELDFDPSIRWCINTKCDNYLRGSAENPKLICKCGEAMCFNCSMGWHEGKTCNEIIDLEYENYKLKMNMMDCPKCKSRIEKISGCNHMSCTRCHYEFCWICGEKYTRRHYKNYNIFGCPGLMYNNVKRSKGFIRMHRIKYIVKFVCTCLIFVLGIPLLAIAGLFCLPNILYINNRKLRGRTFYCDCHKILTFILLGILGIVISPFVLAFAIVPGTCLVLKIFFKD